MALFELRERTDPSPATHSESTYAFLDRVDDPAFDRVRDLFEDWYANYARIQEARASNDLRRRLTSKDDTQFQGAFWELYLHEVHHLSGYEIRTHPKLGPEAKQRPDFELTTPDGRRLFLEATVFFGPRSATGANPGQARLFDLLNEVHSPDFFLKVEFAVAPSTEPSRGEIVGQVESWLKELRWEDVQVMTDYELDDLPARQFTVRDGVFKLRVHPRSAESRGDPSIRPIGIYPSLSGWGSPDAIREKLRDKTRHLRQLDGPLIVAMLPLSPFTTPDQIEYALYGDEGFSVPVGPGAEHVDPSPVRMPGALFRGGTQARNTRISGVLAGNDFGFPSIARTWPVLWENPWAERALFVHRAPWPRIFPDDDGVLRRHEAPQTPAAFFGLDELWPGRPFERR